MNMSFLKRKPASLVKINEIDREVNNYKIKVQVMKLWNLQRGNKISSIEMVLVDEDGTRIHASIDEAFVKTFDGKLVEYSSYVISNFTFSDYNTLYRTNPLDFKITFYSTTNITSCDEFTCNLTNKYFKDFKEIQDGLYDNEILIDVIGQITNVGTMEDKRARGKPLKKLDITLRDKQNQSLTCTLWGDYGKQVIDYVGANKSRLIICVVRFACVNEWKEVFSISNSFNATQLLFDPQTPQVEEFIRGLPKDNPLITNHDSYSFNPPKIDWEEEFFRNNQRKTIEEILKTTEEGKYVTSAKVASIQTTPKWYYLGCKTCRKGVHPCEDVDDENAPIQFYCVGCDVKTSDINVKYKIVMFVMDDKEYEAKLIVFDNIAAPFLRAPAIDLANQVAEEHPSVLPDALAKLIGKELLFKIAVTEDNLMSSKISYKVDLILDDEYYLKRFNTQQSSKTGSVVNPEETEITSSLKASQRTATTSAMRTSKKQKTSNQ